MLLLFCAASGSAQNYASFGNQPVSRMSFLRHQFKPSQNAFRDGSLIGYWPLSEGAGTTVYDESGNGDSGSWVNSAAGTNGYYSAGKTAAFSGFFANTPANRVNLTSGLSLTGALTYCAWINTFGLGSAHIWLGDTDTNGLKVGGNTGATAFARLYNGGSSLSAGSIPLNTWHLMTITRDGSNAVVLYFDAVSIATASSQSGTSAPAFIGSAAPAGAQWWDGPLQNVRIYNRALTQSEIQAIYNAENH